MKKDPIEIQESVPRKDVQSPIPSLFFNQEKSDYKKTDDSKLISIENDIVVSYEIGESLPDNVKAIQDKITLFWEQAIKEQSSPTQVVTRSQLIMYEWNNKLKDVIEKFSKQEEKIFTANQMQKFWVNLLTQIESKSERVGIYNFGITQLETWNQHLHALLGERLLSKDNSRYSMSFISDMNKKPEHRLLGSSQRDSGVNDQKHERSIDWTSTPINKTSAPQNSSEKRFQHDFEKAENIQQKIKVIFEAITHYYQQVLALPNTHYYLMPAPKKNLSYWIQSLKQLYGNYDGDLLSQHFLVAQAQSFWIKLRLTNGNNSLINYESQYWNKHHAEINTKGLGIKSTTSDEALLSKSTGSSSCCCLIL